MTMGEIYAFYREISIIQPLWKLEFKHKVMEMYHLGVNLKLSENIVQSFVQLKKLAVSLTCETKLRIK